MNTISNYWKEDVRSAGGLLSKQAVSGDVVIVPETQAFSRYYSGGAGVITINEVLGQEQKALAEVHPDHTIWLVYYREWLMDPQHEIRTWLNQQGRMVCEFSFPNCKIFGYRLNFFPGTTTEVSALERRP